MRAKILTSLCGLICALSVCAGSAAPIPIIYSTDLFHPHEDPDDHFDLACLFSIPEADLRAVVLDQGDCQSQRPGFKPVLQLNHLTGRAVPAAIGLRDKLKTPADSGLDQPAEFQKGVNTILSILQEASERITIVFVGSARDVAAARNRRPDLFREKVRGVYGFIGDAGDPGHQEWNVGLDPQAFISLMRSDVPFFWIPCFDGGPGKNNGHASFWRAGHGDLLGNASAPLQRYFLYMLRKAPSDPVAHLSQPMSEADRDWSVWGQRNLWCGALLGLAVGRTLTDEGSEVVGFSPVEVSIDDKAVVHYGKTNGSRSVMRFEIKDRARFQAVATRATAELLRSFPLHR